LVSKQAVLAEAVTRVIVLDGSFRLTDALPLPIKAAGEMIARRSLGFPQCDHQATPFACNGN
jgi:hypothetical protein